MKKQQIHRYVAGWLLAIFLFVALPAFAVEELTDPSMLSTEAPKEEEKPAVDSRGRPLVDAEEAVILVEQSGGAMLYGIREKDRMFPASTTKIMTGYLAAKALQEGTITKETPVTVTPEMLEGLAIDGSTMSLKEGEVLTFEQLFRGMMIPSGNDAAMAIAATISGSVPAFVDLMNQTAADLGATDTHFENPHGLHSDNHYTTAADLAKITCAAMDLPEFRDVVDIAHVKIPPTNLTEERYYINTNGLISAMRYLDYVYKGATGVKTGSTEEAGKCLVASAQRNGVELICVVLHAKDIDTQHKDAIRLMDWGFDNHQGLYVVRRGDIVGETKVKQARGKDTVTLKAKENLVAVVPKDVKAEDVEIQLHLPEKLYAPLAEGQEVAEASVHYNGQELSRGPLVTIMAVKRSFFWPALALGEWLWSFLLVRIVVYLFLIVLALAVLLFVHRVYDEIMRQKRLKKEREKRRLKN